MATITDGTTIITIPDSLEWTDEFNFTPVTQDTRRTIGGSFIVQEGSLFFGRPITLTGGEQVWLARSTWRQVFNFASLPGQKFTLTLADGTVYTVIFRHDGNRSPATADPLWRRNIQTNEDMVKNITLRFYTVEANS